MDARALRSRLAFTHANTGMTMLEWGRGRGLLIKVELVGLEMISGPR